MRVSPWGRLILARLLSTRGRWLVAVLGAAGVGQLTALLACCPPVFHDEVYLLGTPPSPSLQAMVDACRASGGAGCLPLCRALTGQATLAHCELHSDSHGYTQIHTGWSELGACE